MWWIIGAVLLVVVYASGYWKGKQSIEVPETDDDLELQLEQAQDRVEEQERELAALRNERDYIERQRYDLEAEMSDLPEQVLTDAETRIFGGDDSIPDGEMLSVQEVRRRLRDE